MTSEDCKVNPVAMAIRAAGGRKELAKAISPAVTRQAVEYWLSKGEIPPSKVPEVARVTGIPKKLLNPIFNP